MNAVLCGRTMTRLDNWHSVKDLLSYHVFAQRLLGLSLFSPDVI